MVKRIPGKQGFIRVLNKTDFGLTADVALITTDFTKIGSYKVPAQQMISWGADEFVTGGVQGLPGQIDAKDVTPAVIPGVVRLAMTDATGIKKVVVLEERIERFNQSPSDRTKAVLIRETLETAKQDSFLTIEMKSDAAATLKFANSTVILPVTVYY